MDALSILRFVAGLVFLVVGAELLVRGASKLATAAGISPLVVGLTVVAFGTSSPEVAASLAAAVQGQGDIAFGNVIGSNIFNILLILGLSAIVAPLIVAIQLVRIDVPIMIGSAVALVVMGLDGRIGRVDGLILFGSLVVYIVYTLRASRREGAQTNEREEARARGGKAIALNLLWVVLGLAVLVLGARWLVDGAVAAARAFGVSELVISLTIIAAGTSLPEVAASLIAAFRGQRDIAVGNVVGSNIFNILCVMGLAGLLSPDGVPAARSAMVFDIPVMLAASVACLPIFFSGFRIDRWEGFLLFGYYCAYVAFVLLAAAEHAALDEFSWIMLAFVLPLTVVTLVVVGLRAFRRHRQDAA